MIVTLPDKILREKSKPVAPDKILSSETKNLIKQMREEVAAAGGVGLAAVQIGVLKQVILVEIDGKFSAFINPKITKRSWKKIAAEEGCLSVPGKFGMVKRNERVTVRAIDEAGNKIEMKTKGIPAVIFQHEIDHTNGILFIDKLAK
jgi:peptide deformylase